MENKALLLFTVCEAAALWRASVITEPPGEGAPAEASGATSVLLPLFSDKLDGSEPSKFVASGCLLFSVEWPPSPVVRVLDRV